MLCPNCNKEFSSNFCPDCGYQPTPTPTPAPLPAKSPRRTNPGCLVALLVAIVLLVVLLLIGSFASSSDSSSSASGSAGSSAAQPSSVPDSPSSAAPSSAAPSSAAPIAVTVQLSSGHYTSGVDFPAGTYDITAVSGTGNVSSSNLFDRGINSMMGVVEEDDIGASLYEDSFRNVDLPNESVLTVSGSVVISINCSAASGEPLTPRNQSITEVVTLSGGNYVAGKDFPAGIYDIAAVSGTGNVSSSNLFDEGINAMMGISDTVMADAWQQQFLHVRLPADTEFKVSGVDITLTPSK